MAFIFTKGEAQYFGRNKPKYRSLDFDVLITPHFEVYHHFVDSSIINDLARDAEYWYKMHQDILKDTILFKNPIIFYKNHAEFQQTNAISSTPSIGTGGVTEVFKNRVIMPVTESNYQTDHVLGHELVHAFQYNLLLRNSEDDLSFNSIANLPLWMVEGMAEYLSIGSVDSHTAMWMRDAVEKNDVPSIKDLTTSNKYFPYRYGHAFWSFVNNTWGDSIIHKLFLETARYGYQLGIKETFGFSHDSLSNRWNKSLKEYYSSFKEKHAGPIIGKKILDDKTAGTINISPSISPDGNYLMFLSEKDVFTLDLYLADAKTGIIIKKLSTASRDPHVDDLSYLESAGAWSEDSKRFAYVVFSKGVNKIAILNIHTRQVLELIEIPEVPALNGLSWSADGTMLAFTGLVEGQSDLYVYNLRSTQLKRLTNDRYSDIQPSWMADNQTLVFSTDRPFEISSSDKFRYDSYSLGLIDLKGNITMIPAFMGADNLNPIADPNGNSIYFLSNRDGFRNIYKYDIEHDVVSQCTNYFTGVSGITPTAPAMSISRLKEYMAYVYYSAGKYSIYSSSLSSFTEVEVVSSEIDLRGAYLPPYDPQSEFKPQVEKNVETKNERRDTIVYKSQKQEYRAKLGLDYIGNVGIGVTTSTFGTNMVGGVNLSFSDILGDKQLVTVVSIQGEISDFGGLVAYINKKNRVNWGVAASHVPYRYGWYSIEQDTVQVAGDTLAVDNLATNLVRQFEDQLSVFLWYPLSKTKRLELEGSYTWYSTRYDKFNNYYYNGFYVGDKLERDLPTPPGYSIEMISGAYVHDRSFFGMTSPLRGNRYRIQAEQYFGELNMFTTLFDYRHYVFIKPFSIAFRGLHYARYGSNEINQLLSPIFIGAPGLIHGYTVNSFYEADRNDLNINQLLGNKIFISNLELRLPFSGPRALATFSSSILFMDVNLFFDGGIAWSLSSEQTYGESFTNSFDREPIFSTGISFRINLLGALIIEPYYAIPLSRKVRRDVIAVNFIPGW